MINVQRVRISAQCPYRNRTRVAHQHFIEHAPEEAVVLLIGTPPLNDQQLDTGFVQHILPIVNTHSDPKEHFCVRQWQLDTAQFLYPELAVVGVMHSHPEEGILPIPSTDDVEGLPPKMIGAVWANRQVMWYWTTRGATRRNG